MSTHRRIAVVTGSRAEFDIWRPVLAALTETGAFDVELAVTGMHLSPEFGGTASEVEASGYPIAARVETLLSSDTPVGMAKAVGLGIIGFADAWGANPPDLVFVLGDRFEMLAAAEAAYLLDIPIAHLFGGDLTEGALDDGLRHAITKLSHLHFASNAPAAARLRQMGEAPERVVLSGSPQIDAIRAFEPLPLTEVETALGWTWRERTLLVTFHPVTRGTRSTEAQVDALIAALDRLGDDSDGGSGSAAWGVIITLPNADAEGRMVRARMEAFAEGRDDVLVRTSLGYRLYYSCMAHAAAVVGNSSSGLYEAPSFGTPTVDIGDRQGARLRGPSVVNVETDAEAIEAAIRGAVGIPVDRDASPFGDGTAARKIAAALACIEDFGSLRKKRFVDLDPGVER